MKKALLLFLLALSLHAYADEARKQALITEIIKAQGLQQMFQQQLEQSKMAAAEFGKDFYRRILTETGISPDQKDPKLEQAFDKYLERAAFMFSAHDLVSMWAKFYGEGLTEDDLEKILAYYTSPTGKKEVQATQNAMIGFTQFLSVEGQRRMDDLLRQLLADIRAAVKN